MKQDNKPKMAAIAITLEHKTKLHEVISDIANQTAAVSNLPQPVCYVLACGVVMTLIDRAKSRVEQQVDRHYSAETIIKPEDILQ